MEQTAILDSDPGAVEIVTEVRREAALLKAGALQNAIFNSANFSSIATDEKGVIQIFNVGAERMLGYTAAEVVNKVTPAEISDPQEVIARARALSLELETTIAPGFEALVFKASRGIEDVYELTYFRKDGSRFPAVVSVTALRGDDGEIIGYLLIGTDNTARKRAEEALLKAGALQSAIFNSANFSSIATDAKGVIQIFNVGAERMLGYTAAEVMNKITPADISDPREVIARARALSLELETTISPGFEALVFKASRGIEDIYELTYIRKDGSRFPAVVSVTALRDGQGGIIGYLLIGTDNTARKRAEEALLKAGALQSAIFNSANFSSIATDAKGVIQIFNVGAERMLGYAAGDVMNKITPADISDPQEVIARAKALSRELETTIAPGFEALVFKASRGIEDIYELTYIRKDGSRFPAVVSVTALRDGQGGIIGYLLIGTDNTARKRAEEALLKAGALQSAIFNSANFSSIATDEKGVIQIFNVGAERMLGYTAAEVLNKITPAEISDSQEVIARAKALSQELGTTIAPGFEALVFKASRGIEDVYELTYIRKDGSRFPAVVSVTALRDGQGGILGYLLIGTDNTARKQVEEERKRLDQRLRDQQFYTRSLIESNIDALVTTDPLGIITDVNKQMEALTDCTRDELIGAPFKKYFTDPQRAEEGIKLMLSGKKVTDYELTTCARDGKKTVVSYNATTFYDRDRKLQGVFAAARDVTERKQADEELQRANAKLKAWAQALDSFAIVAETDTQGRITYANDPFCRISKYSREELLGKDHRELVNSGHHAKEFWKEMWTTISRGQIWRGEVKNRAKDGTVYWVDTVIVPLLGANGKPETYLAIRFVITERKMAEESQRISSAYARSLIEASLDPLVTISSEGKITDVNEASVQATGVRREELIATDFSDYFTEPDKARAGYQKVFSEGFVRDYPLAIRHVSSRITDVLYNASVYKDDKGKVLGVFAVARDVTERKRFELALQETNVKLETAKSAAEKANLAKSDFLSSMSHELRSPLNAILGFAQLMESASPSPTASQTKSIAQILQAGWYLLKLINEVLDLAVIESGKVSLSKEPVSLAQLMSECQSMMEPQAQQSGIRMTFPRFDHPVYVAADRTRLKQIIINLVSNAIKYNQEQGTVAVDFTVSAPPFSDLGAAGPGRIRFSVKDTGAGLPREKLAQLFQPFNRLGQEAGSVAGTGIGLVVSKRLAELMGGVLGVESIVGLGSVFWCELNSAAAPEVPVLTGEAEAPVRPQPSPGSPRRTLLYVEDNPANMRLVEQLIERFPDIDLITAVNGTLGIELARATQPQVVLMDINLPGISGIKALKILRQDPATAHIPVIALSANAMARDVARGLEAGFFRYITKPIKIDEFMDTLNEALESVGRVTKNITQEETDNPHEALGLAGRATPCAPLESIETQLVAPTP
jgi:PAS domain S-box-containing protein